MRLRHIEIFNAIYTTGSVTAAANFLNVSQPSVSKVLQHAEDQLGFTLFDRARNGMVPTKEAHQLFIDVEKVNKQISALNQSARNLRDKKTEHIRIAMITGLGFNVTPRAIAKFQEHHPDVTFELTTEHFPALCLALLEYRADIGLVFQPPSHPGIQNVILGSAEFVCVLPKERMTKAGRIDLNDISDLPFISMAENGPLGGILASELSLRNIHIKPSIIAGTGFMAKNLARAGLGCTVIDEFSAAAASIPELDCRKIEPPIKFTVNGLYAKTHPVSNTCREFFSCFKEVFSQMGDGGNNEAGFRP